MLKGRVRLSVLLWQKQKPQLWHDVMFYLWIVFSNFFRFFFQKLDRKQAFVENGFLINIWENVSLTYNKVVGLFCFFAFVGIMCHRKILVLYVTSAIEWLNLMKNCKNQSQKRIAKICSCRYQLRSKNCLSVPSKQKKATQQANSRFFFRSFFEACAIENKPLLMSISTYIL